MICNFTDKDTQPHASDASRLRADLVLLVCNLGTGKFIIFLYFVGTLVFEIFNSTIIVDNFSIPLLLLAT